jgi:hypothetical protein
MHMHVFAIKAKSVPPPDGSWKGQCKKYMFKDSSS